MTAVPLPSMPWPVRHEVSGASVLHPLRETQQHPHVIVSGLGAVGGAGETLFLSSTPERIHVGSLDVGGSLNIVWIRDQVGQTSLFWPINIPIWAFRRRIGRISSWRNGLKERGLWSSKWWKLLILGAPHWWLPSWSAFRSLACIRDSRVGHHRPRVPIIKTVCVSVV